MFIELHRTSEQPHYHLGSIEVDDEIAQDDPETLVQTWWDEFQATQPESDALFVDHLVQQGYAKDESWDGDPNNSPHHVYL